MTITKKISVDLENSNIKKLIDLNEDTINFELTFDVSCNDDTPFYVLVVDQTTLDTTPNLQYNKVVNRSINGKIVSDNNVYQNYFLILKSEAKCTLDIEINKKILPKNPNKILTPNNLKQTLGNPKKNDSNDNTKSSFSWMKIFLIILVLIIGGAILWSYYKKSQTENSQVDVNNSNKYIQYFSTNKEVSHNNSSHNNSSHNNSSQNNDSRAYKPFNNADVKISPNLMTRQYSIGENNSKDSLLYRLNKFSK